MINVRDFLQNQRFNKTAIRCTFTTNGHFTQRIYLESRCPIIGEFAVLVNFSHFCHTIIDVGLLHQELEHGVIWNQFNKKFIKIKWIMPQFFQKLNKYFVNKYSVHAVSDFHLIIFQMMNNLGKSFLHFVHTIKLIFIFIYMINTKCFRYQVQTVKI